MYLSVENRSERKHDIEGTIIEIVDFTVKNDSIKWHRFLYGLNGSKERWTKAGIPLGFTYLSRPFFTSVVTKNISSNALSNDLGRLA